MRDNNLCFFPWLHKDKQLKEILMLLIFQQNTFQMIELFILILFGAQPDCKGLLDNWKASA